MRRPLVLAVLAACSSSTPPAAPALVAPPAKGEVTTQTFHSAALGVDKHVLVYLPAGYATEPAERWPVFYYLHGLGGNETNWVQHGKLEAAADGLGLRAIVVMPDGDDKFYIDSPVKPDYDACMRDGAGLYIAREPRGETCVHANRYETYIVQDLIGWVDSSYRTIASRDGRGVAGLSMGGYGALVLGMRHADLFAAAASHSGVGSWFLKGPRPFVSGQPELVTDVTNWGGEIGPMGVWIRNLFGPDITFWREHDAATLAATLEPGKLALYLDCGTEDDLGLDLGAAYLHDILATRKIDHTYFIGPGHHDFRFWSARLPASLAFLRDHTTAAR